ncbi:MAG: hypothetical protein K8U57_28795 [Planctomycetes bacterium]|nr:hypothetical protein [Planctomycetota bacterium]
MRAEQLLEEQARMARRERAEAERLAYQRAEDEDRRARIKAARNKKEKLERIREEITKATEHVESCTAAWHRAGSPVVHKADIDDARGKVRRLQGVLRKENRKRRLAFAKMTYLRIASYARQTADRSGIPWFAPVLIFGAICFASTVVIVLPFVNGRTLALSLGGIGFLLGLVFMLCVFFVPSDENLWPDMTLLTEEQGKGQEARKAAWLAYETARDEYEMIAGLRQLRTDCDEAAQRKLHFEEEYQLVSAE